MRIATVKFKIKGKLVNLDEAAQIFGVTPNAVRTWIKKDLPVVKKGDARTNKPWQLDTLAIHEWLLDQKVGEFVSTAEEAGQSVTSINEAKRLSAVAKAEADAIDLEVKRGKYVDIDIVTEAIAKQFRACAQKLLAIPAKIAPMLVSVTDVNEAKDLVDDELREALNELSGFEPGQSGDPSSASDDGSFEDVDDAAEDDEAAPEDDGEPMGGRI